jgi:hypothetical protein
VLISRHLLEGRMNTLLLNRDGFQMPADGWYQMAPLGEFAHAAASVVQVVDQDACESMVNRFRAEAQVPNFAGLLVDFDHFSLDGEKRSEAAGWITNLEVRDHGLFGQIRWSDVGEEAVKGGRYRFLSPVWARSDCVDLGNGRLRPVRLLNAALTNDPNLKGMIPLSNSAAAAGNEPCVRKNSGAVLCAVCGAECAGMLANTGWTDEARAASLAVRRAKAASRASDGGSGGSTAKGTAAKAWADAAIASYRAKFKRDPVTDAEIATGETLAKVPAEYRTDGAPEPAEKGPTPSPSPTAKRDANGFEYDERYGPHEEAAFVKKYGHTPRNTAERYEAERLGAASPAETTGAGGAKADVARMKAEQRKQPDSGIRVLPVLRATRRSRRR